MRNRGDGLTHWQKGATSVCACVHVPTRPCARCDPRAKELVGMATPWTLFWGHKAFPSPLAFSLSGKFPYSFQREIYSDKKEKKEHFSCTIFPTLGLRLL